VTVTQVWEMKSATAAHVVSHQTPVNTGMSPAQDKSLPHPNISSVNPEEAATVIRETKRSRYDGLHTGGVKIQLLQLNDGKCWQVCCTPKSS
jgi:hypothetical protein